ncbi:MAG: ATP-dependent helicase RecQ [Solirubrobacteraceae bacterium]|jgi:ATP-dependent DNA helicase RecQ|nr:ATP-dependent helicase RecQ [Solirubrobacteraceae bacterium]
MDRALAALREHFGFTAFRPGQAEAVDAALAGRDLLVVMPTGAGKSLCYQLPALMRPDLALVVSPLVSLMQDQVEALERAVPGRAALVNSQQDAGANRAAIARAAAGELKLLYVAPERFSSPGFLEAIRGVDVGLFVVDEAHCVSQWGHDFRPDYFRLADAARWLGARAIVASTATATPQVATDIGVRLGLRDPVRVTTGFDRPNLSFAVVPCRGPADKRARLAAALAEPEARPAIVYAGTRADTERIAGDLGATLGVQVLAYHAGLPRDARADAQRRFMAGAVEVVVATNAFGMGVDKADVRTVAHASVPGSVEAYYQEAGRAGRDGRPARALLLAEARDKGLHVFFIQRAEVDDAAVAGVAERLGAAVGTLPLGEASGTFDVGIDELGDDPERVRAIVGHLARAGVIRPAPAPMDRVRGRLEAPFDGRARAACRASAGEAQRARWRQYRSVWAFVEGDTCRRETILRHFGDRSTPEPSVPCCDVCAPELVPAAPTAAARHAAAAVAGGRAPGDLDAAIVEVVSIADPSVGRTRTVEILRGGRSQALRRHAYDGLPLYGTFGHLAAGEVLERVDALLAAGRLRSTGGAYPKLRVVAEVRAA